jgi:hypothetical protein
VSLIAGVLGEDILHLDLLAATFLFWLGMFAAIAWMMSKRTRAVLE